MTEPALLAKARARQMPLPEGVTEFGIALGGCQICGGSEYTRDRANLTCSVTVNDRGLHDLQSHQEWCPVVASVQAPITCPICGAGVNSYDYAPGYTLRVLSPRGGYDHAAGTLDEVTGVPGAQLDHNERPVPAPAFDKVTVSPCEHVLEGDDARNVRQTVAQHHIDERAAEVEAELSEHSELLASVEAHGAAVIAEKYREAVRTRSADAAGLLAAMRVLEATR